MVSLLAQLPGLGLTQVEGFAGVYRDPHRWRTALEAAGVGMPSGHIMLADIERDFTATLTLARTLGMTRIYVPFLAPDARPSDAAGYARLSHRLNTLARRYGDAGLSFGWHNHEFEFQPLADGSMPMDILLGEAPDLSWEADLAWIARGGQAPLAYITRYADRINALHVKDIAPMGAQQHEDGWANLGAGVMDWAALLGACRVRCSDLLYVLEHDNPSDPLGYLRASAAAFKTLWQELPHA